MAVPDAQGGPAPNPRTARSSRPARRGRSAGRHDERMRDDAPAGGHRDRADGEAACGKPAAGIPIRPPSGVPSPEGPTSRWAVSAASEHTHRPAAVAGAGRVWLARRSRARRGPRSVAWPTPSGWRRCSCSRGPSLWPCGRSPTPGWSRSCSRGPRWRPATPSPACGPWTTSTCCCPQADHRRALEALAPRRVAGGPRRRWRPLRHRADPPRGALVLPGGALRAGGRVATGDGARSRRAVGARQPLECAGTPAFGLPPAEELVVLAAHAGKPHHRFVRLVWIADLAMIVGDAATARRRHRLGPCARRGRGRTVRDGGRRRPGDGPPGRRGRARRAVPAARPGAGGATPCAGCSRSPGR